MKRTVTKAIFPVAGLGTRFLPATKSVPKEIMTLVDRPLIQYAIDEARAAGIKEFIFVTSRGKSALEDYFDDSPILEQELRKKKKLDLLEELKRTTMDSGQIAYIRQHRAKGLGHAVACARRMIHNEPFAVILPDDVIAAETSCLAQMIEAYAETGGSMVAAMEVAPDRTSSYGILDVDSTDSQTSRLGAGAGGEIQLTDAIAREIDGDGVYGFRFEGQRYDCGSKAGFLQATVAFGLARPDLRDELSAFLSDLSLSGT